MPELQPPSVSLLRAALDLSTDGFIASDDRGLALWVNRTGAQLIGLPAEAIVGKPVRPFSALSDLDFATAWSALLSQGQVQGSGFLRRSDGGEVYVEYELRAEVAPGQHLLRFRPVAKPDTEVPHALANVRMRAILDNAPVVLFAVDREGRFTHSEGRGLLEIGLEAGELVGRSAAELYGDTRFTDVGGTVFTGQEILARVMQGHRFVGSSPIGAAFFDHWFMPVCSPEGRIEGFIGVSTVATERRRLEAQLRLSDRLATVGALAAGVAHELNNPLAYVLSNLGSVTRSLRERFGEAPAEPDLAEILSTLGDVSSGAERMRVIVRDLKAFARDDDGAREAVDLSRVVEMACAMADHEVRRHARIIRELAHGLPAVCANEARLGQVLLNLLVNAAHAIAETGSEGGEIRVRAASTEGERVSLEVHDNGVGIPPENLGRIFDPFFTTKRPGTGTGLGLPISLRIVEELGGTLEVQSTVGRGSVFRVVLPAAAEDAEVAVRAPQAPAARRLRVLIVDDNPRVAQSLARALDEDCAVATSAADALTELERAPDFDLIVCDVMMPGISGPALAAKIVERWPALGRAIVLVTGGAFDPEVRAELEASPFPKLEKPFDLEKLKELAGR